MGFTTQGKIKVVIEADGKKTIKILPTNDYGIVRKKVSYTIFLDEKVDKDKYEDKKVDVLCFGADTTFAVGTKTADCLIELAVKDICLEITITIDGVAKPKVTTIQVPA